MAERLANRWRIAPLLAVSVLLGACSATPGSSGGGLAAIDHYRAGRPNYKVGAPYEVKGVWYYPAVNYDYDKTGIASWYGGQFNGQYTANGEIFNLNQLTAAHTTLPLPSIVEVTNLENGRSLRLRVNDRGPFADGRIIDVSRRAAQLLGFEVAGTAPVRVQVLRNASIRVAEAAMRHSYGTETRFAEASTPPVTVAPVAAAPVASAPAPVTPAPMRLASAAPPAAAYPAPAYAAPADAAPAYEAPTYRAPAYSAPAYASNDTAPAYAASPYPAPAYSPPAYPASTYRAPAYAATAPREPAAPSPAYRANSAPVYRAPLYAASAERISPEREPAYRDRQPVEHPVVAQPGVALFRTLGSELPARERTARLEPRKSISHIFIQAGAFALAANAQRVSSRIAPLGAVEVERVSVRGAPMYRVRVGPVSSVAAADHLLSRVVNSGYPGARIVFD